MKNKVKTYEVYKVTNNITGKVYVGITNQGFKIRWYKHCSDSIRGSMFPLHLAIRKYGIDNFTVQVIEICDTVDILKSRESYWIKELDSKNKTKGYNLTDGGDGTFGRKHSEESKQKMRDAVLNRTISDETRRLMSLNSSTRRGINILNSDGEIIHTFDSVTDAAAYLGTASTNISKCARSNLKYSVKGFKFEYWDKVKIKHFSKPVESKKLYKPLTEETKLKISISNKEHWDETRRKKVSENNPKNKSILQYTKLGDFVAEYYNVSEAARCMGTKSHTNIAKCARGIIPYSCGYVWKYKQ